MSKEQTQCPRCDARDTLTPVRGEGNGVIVAECSCCSAVVRIHADGSIIHTDSKHPDKHDRRGA